MFKGWGSDDKEDEDPRQTIRDTGRDDSSKLSYENIVKSCTKDGCLWEDPDFPAENSSLGDSAAKGIEWKRPKVSKLIYNNRVSYLSDMLKKLSVLDKHIFALNISHIHSHCVLFKPLSLS